MGCDHWCGVEESKDVHVIRVREGANEIRAHHEFYLKIWIKRAWLFDCVGTVL
jgi:hypothetical protein